MIKNIFKKIQIAYFNKLHNVNIMSETASLKAQYSNSVFIGKGTTISNNVIIGKYSYINRNSTILNCIIGNYCSISYGVHIAPAEHELNYISTHPFLYESCYGFVSTNSVKISKGVRIGNDVLISTNAIILDGVKIGDGAVIAAGAVVTSDIRPYEIVGGVPAKHIRYRFSCEMIEKLLELKWWDWTEEKIKKNIGFLKECDFNNIV